MNTYSVRITSGVSDVCPECAWSGTTFRRTSLQLPNSSDATHSSPMEQPGCGCTLPQPGQLTISDDIEKRCWPIRTTSTTSGCQRI